MAIYGNLSEFPFLEVINMLGQRTGVLSFSHLRPYESVELQLERGHLQGLSVDGVPIFDLSMAHSYLTEIAAQRSADFEFRKLPALSARQPLSIVVKDALLRGNAAEDSKRIPADHLPDPQTRFSVGAAPVAFSDANLKAFWIAAQPLLLLRGSSAESLARELRLEVGNVQLMFYQLRTIGAIRPVRRIEETMPIKADAVQTHLAATHPAATHPAAQTHPATQPHPVTHAPKPTLIAKLLGALSFVRRAS